MIREAIDRIMQEYPAAKRGPMKNSPLATWIRKDLPQALRMGFPEYPNLIWEASPGKGRWIDAPWIVARDPSVMPTVQDGFCPAYVFTKSLDAVYLSLNQGAASISKRGGRTRVKKVLTERATLLRRKLTPEYRKRFSERPIDLQPSQPSSRIALYELGHAIGIKYEKGHLPTENQLRADLAEMLELYQLAIIRGGTHKNSLGEQTEEDPHVNEELTLEENKRYRDHRALERNSQLAEKAKQVHGCTCQVCGFNFENTYGDLGKRYIEAHHLTPLAQLPPGKPVQVSPKNDFAVVCANCHRVIHRRGAPATFPEFVEFYRKRNS